METGTPGGRGQGHREDATEQARRALADRIEDNLTRLLGKVEGILRENETHVLALAHALETHKTLNGEDVTAVMEGHVGPVVDGTPYASPGFIEELRRYHEAAARAHRDHNSPDVPLPVPPQPVLAAVVADGYGDEYSLDTYDTATGATGSTANGSTSNGMRTGSYGDIMEDTQDDIVSRGPDEDGFYEPPTYGPQDGSPNGHPNGQS